MRSATTKLADGPEVDKQGETESPGKCELLQHLLIIRSAEIRLEAARIFATQPLALAEKEQDEAPRIH